MSKELFDLFVEAKHNPALRERFAKEAVRRFDPILFHPNPEVAASARSDFQLELLSVFGTQKEPGAENTAHLIAWLAKVARSKVAAANRTERRQSRVTAFTALEGSNGPSESLLDNLRDDSEPFAEPFEGFEHLPRIREAFGLLREYSPKQAAAIEAVMHGDSLTVHSNAAGTSRQAQEMHYQRGMDNLRAILKHFNPGLPLPEHPVLPNRLAALLRNRLKTRPRAKT